MAKANWVYAGICAAALVAGATGCDMDSNHSTKSSHTMATNSNSLYNRLGGEPAITAVCDDFIDRAVKDTRVNFFRKGVPGATEWKPSPEEVATFRKHLIQFVCMATGGPQKYEGESMKASHRGMKITEAEFNALAGDLAASLDKFKVPAKEKNELLAAVAGTKKDIVEVNNRM